MPDDSNGTHVSKGGAGGVRGKHRRILSAIVAIGLLASAALSGCAPKKSDEGGPTGAKDGGKMSFYINEPAYIDPYNAQESEGMQVTQVLFDSLTWFDDLDPTKLLPSAAVSWEPNEDATVWTFKLNPDGKFSDGTPVKASDFVYAWNRVVNPKTINTSTGQPDPSIVGYHLGFVKGYDAVVAGTATEMEGVKAVDDLTLEVTLTQPFADFEYVVAHPALSPVPKALVEGGVEYNGDKVPYGDMPVGNGSFKMSEPWNHNQYIKVERNDEYAGDSPHLDGVDFMIFKDPETAYTEFEAGNLDFVQIGEGKIEAAKTQHGESKDGYTVNPGEQVLLGEQNSTYYLILNMNDATLKNADLRKAISLAINRQAICDTVFEGTRGPADNILPPGIAGYKKGGWADSKYDVEAAKAALADAGYPNGEGLPKIRLGFNSGGGHEKIMELVQADLKAVGITAEFESLDWSAYLKMLDEGKHQVARLGWIADYPIAYNFLYALFDSGSADNKSKYVNPNVDKGIAEANAITDGDARLAKFEEVNEMIAADNPVVPVMFYRNNHVGSDRLHNFIFNPMHFGNFDKVWVEEPAADGK